MLDLTFCRQRQQRLLPLLAERKLDAVVVGSRHHVYYFTGFLTRWLHHSAFVLFRDGSSWLVRSHREESDAAADHIVSYEADWLYTLRQEQPQVVATAVADELTSRNSRRLGIDDAAVTAQLGLVYECSPQSVEPDLWQMRRRKDPDELALLRKAIACTEAMYARAKEIIEPGIPELKLYGELHTAAVETAGEQLSAMLGNDYACGTLGGPPREGRVAESGELYILDLGPAYRGYFADNTRTFAVNRQPTEAQYRAWETTKSALELFERMARPGASCRELYAAVDDHFKAAGAAGCAHHLGHGVGLQPHEFPHFNPNWDDTLLEGEVLTAEPGMYGPEFGGGVRLENEYLVTADGVRNLLDFPLDLT